MDSNLLLLPKKKSERVLVVIKLFHSNCLPWLIFYYYESYSSIALSWALSGFLFAFQC
jgi:hypothetical protein